MELDLTLGGVLLLGLAVGLQHALEADHLAAVSSLVSGERSWRRIVRHGAVWGVGHTCTLAVVAGTAIVLGSNIDGAVANWLEFAVGAMLVILGGQVLWRMVSQRIHFHVHKHADSSHHWHAHSHAGENINSSHDHAAHPHDHAHSPISGWRTLMVGMVHGMAGSAVLVVLAASQIDDPGFKLFYVVTFGFGSIVGMAGLSVIVAVPLSWTARTISWANNLLQGGIGTVTLGLGMFIVFETGVSHSRL
ncbi:MAG: urease accessory protein [Alphaproteobacteria bacterium]|nr:high frequency lysogenization protein HflD [Rhodospirillales bacterium]MDW3206147.1 urease accessory protein [Alphaproteobacteria bacterium]